MSQPRRDYLKFLGQAASQGFSSSEAVEMLTKKYNVSESTGWRYWRALKNVWAEEERRDRPAAMAMYLRGLDLVIRRSWEREDHWVKVSASRAEDMTHVDRARAAAAATRERALVAKAIEMKAKVQGFYRPGQVNDPLCNGCDGTGEPPDSSDEGDHIDSDQGHDADDLTIARLRLGDGSG